ncbi:hypothetical protein FE783_23265 [Paenibacillus mesophilus]|uniref:hypothetical protein n=1 Tax=Paenibacillus mesophilus TaxID=2582849 RepID=UPI00110DF684|nr:hypothetical protein [Paenibacillus mesophilus]TMV47165.1 hypothetical protein FE783_23265 [Paenibacillus mesophilus]
MIVGLLSIFGAYGFAIAIVHLVRSRFRWNRQKPIHYVLITRNNALQIEWYLRTLLFVSRMKARMIHIVVMDERSEDDTMAIAERLAAARPYQIEITEWDESAQLDQMITRYENEEVVLVRLSNKQEMQNIPLFQ